MCQSFWNCRDEGLLPDKLRLSLRLRLKGVRFWTVFRPISWADLPVGSQIVSIDTGALLPFLDHYQRATHKDSARARSVKRTFAGYCPRETKPARCKTSPNLGSWRMGSSHGSMARYGTHAARS
jgi:hypothetical protein